MSAAAQAQTMVAAPTDSHPSGDEFADAMWQHMQKVNQACTQKLNELRRENRVLRSERDEARDRFYELQDQNVAMQDELAFRRPSGVAQ